MVLHSDVFSAVFPSLRIVMEVEFWPGMMSARAANIPLFLCNGQYPNKSYERDKGRILSARDIVPGLQASW